MAGLWRCRASLSCRRARRRWWADDRSSPGRIRRQASFPDARRRAQRLYESVGPALDAGRGYVVAATDYPGLGTPEAHPYLVGDSEARAVLDSVRAARNYGRRGRSALRRTGRFAGRAGRPLYRLPLRRYAPDLQLVGVAAAAPATELATLINADLDSGGGHNSRR